MSPFQSKTKKKFIVKKKQENVVEGKREILVFVSQFGKGRRLGNGKPRVKQGSQRERELIVKKLVLSLTSFLKLSFSFLLFLSILFLTRRPYVSLSLFLPFSLRSYFFFWREKNKHILPPFLVNTNSYVFVQLLFALIFLVFFFIFRK